MSSLPFPFPVVRWEDDQVVLIDQTRLPENLAWRRCGDVPSLCRAIRELAVRGAPAIGVAAAYGLVLSWRVGVAEGLAAGGKRERFRDDSRSLGATRPTAVNLFRALDRMGRAAEDLWGRGLDDAAVHAGLLAEAGAIMAEDLAMCRAMGRLGQALLPDFATVLTHCNAGGLATSGYGTALGVIFAAKEAGKTIRVFADETRPLLQGARLTAWELADQGIEVTVLCEGAAASALRAGRIDAVITGADRIAANGDTANKIGTYPLAVLADRHGVPFYVAAPASTFDATTASGDGIEIEIRDPDEVRRLGGIPTVPEGVGAWNPAFDVTPGELITAFITEMGILRPPFAESLRVIL